MTSTTAPNSGNFSVYDRVIDGAQYFDPLDPANKTAAGYQAYFDTPGGIKTNGKTGTRQNTTSIAASVLDTTAASSVKPPAYSGTVQWNGTLNKGTVYSFATRLDTNIAPDGSLYVLYDTDKNAGNSGAFVLRCSRAYSRYLIDKGYTLTKAKMQAALDSGNLALSPATVKALRSDKLAYVSGKEVIVSGANSAKVLNTLSFKYAVGKYQLKALGTTTNYWDGNARSMIKVG